MVLKQAQTTEIELTGEELDRLIDEEARASLGISGADFKAQLKRGKLSEDDPRVRVLSSLLRLAA